MTNYATTDDFAESDYSEDDQGEMITATQKQLNRASRAIDKLLVTAVYEIGDDGLAVHDHVKAAITAATCAQAAWGIITGNTSGAEAVMGPITLGPLSLGSRTAGGSAETTQSADAARYSPEAILELSNAGLIPGQVWHG